MWFSWLSQNRKAANMAINFPNRSRSCDATRRAVRFWGYDRSMESSFFVTADALNRIQPNPHADAVNLLRAFDTNRERIYAIAAKVSFPKIPSGTASRREAESLHHSNRCL
jgi:Protein of unknown function (DUF1488)